MEWLQREHKLAYHFENTANALEEEMKRVQRQYSPVRAMVGGPSHPSCHWMRLAGAGSTPRSVGGSGPLVWVGGNLVHSFCFPLTEEDEGPGMACHLGHQQQEPAVSAGPLTACAQPARV